LIKFNLIDASEELFKMALNNNWILCLTQDFEEIIITNEIKAGKDRPLLFKEVIESFLAHV
jgi:hypothetical protein